MLTNLFIYVLGCAAAGDLAGSYNGWGHSIAVDPWGSIMEELGEGPGMLMAAVDFAKEDAVRSHLLQMKPAETLAFTALSAIRFNVDKSIYIRFWPFCQGFFCLSDSLFTNFINIGP